MIHTKKEEKDKKGIKNKWDKWSINSKMVGLNPNELSQTARLESCRTSIDKIFNFDKSQVAN